MKSWNELSQEAKNKRRARPSGKVHKKPGKKKKIIEVEYRWPGTEKPLRAFFGSKHFNADWKHYKNYPTIQGAEQAVAVLNKKDTYLKYEYRVKNEKNTKTTKGTS